MPFDQLKLLADQLAKLQSDMLRQVEGEPYAGFSEQVRMFQDGLAQASGDFAEAEALEQAAAEAETAEPAPPSTPGEEPVPVVPKRPALTIPDMLDDEPEEDGSVWKLDWSVMAEGPPPAAGHAPDDAPPADPTIPPPQRKEGKEIWDDLSQGG
jgi:hypothetical protein